MMPRLLWPSWRWMTISGTPSRASSTAWACRSWCRARVAARPSPAVHADLATPSSLAATDEHGTAALIEIGLSKRQRFLNAQPGSPQDHYQPTQPTTVRVVTGGVHDGDDLFHLRRIGRIAQTLVAWGVAGVESRHRRRRSTSTGTIEQKLGHDPSSGSWNEPDYRRQATRGRPRADRRAIASDTEQQATVDPR